ncbi:TerC family protein [Cohnella sp.]|uniref:TerC family protein n=1 Tax=Cohnella sp. TaxID=1883426 RepID=UPI0035698F9A
MEWWLLLLQIMIINIVLSGDNAVVIAMASRGLPLKQRKQAIWFGAFGAIFLRILLTLLAISMLQIPYLQAIGAIFLFWIAVKLMSGDENSDHIISSANLKQAVWTIIVADFVMSLDNVLAVAAKANNDYLLLGLGIGLSIPLIIAGSTLVGNLLNQFPILIYVGTGILGYTAGEMVLRDPKIKNAIPDNLIYFHWLIPALTTMIVIFIGVIQKISSKKKGIKDS